MAAVAAYARAGGVNAGRVYDAPAQLRARQALLPRLPAPGHSNRSLAPVPASTATAVVQGVFTYYGTEMTDDKLELVHRWLGKNAPDDEILDDFRRKRGETTSYNLPEWLVKNGIRTSAKSILGSVRKKLPKKAKVSGYESDHDDRAQDRSLPEVSRNPDEKVPTHPGHGAQQPSEHASRTTTATTTGSTSTPSTSGGGMTEEEEARFRDAFTRRLNRLYEGPAKKKHQEEMENSTSDQRDMARIAWVLAQLNSARVCVAAWLSNDELLLTANTVDKNLASDFERLEKALGDKKTRGELLARVTEATVKELRGNHDPEAVQTKERKAGRRVRKAMRLVERISGKVRAVQYAPAVKDEHAEQTAADNLVVEQTTASGSGGGSSSSWVHTTGSGSGFINSNNAPDSRSTPDLPSSLEGFVAISKLCCGKCAAALEALEESTDVHMEVEGVHLKTYDTGAGWPIPGFLRNDPEAMRHFLGDEAFALYQKDPPRARQIIQEEKFRNQSYAQTDILSSGEESSGEEGRRGSRGKRKPGSRESDEDSG